MKTAVFYGGTDIRVEDRPVPDPRPGEALVAIRAAGICGSDLRHYRNEAPSSSYPMRAGHELSGEVVAIGAGVTRLKAGARVGIEPLHLQGCGRCRQCRRGEYHVCSSRGLRDGRSQHSSGFSEFDIAPVDSLYLLPDGVSFEEAALLDVYGVAFHGVHRVPVRPIDTVVVMGTGAVGLTQGQVARAVGARQVIVVGRRAPPLELALASGAADLVVDTSRVDPVIAILEYTDGEGADVVFETSGDSSAVNMCCEVAGFGGRIGVSSLFSESVSIDASNAMRKELQLSWINSYSSWNGVPEYQLALDLVAAGHVHVAPLVTHRVPLDDIGTGFALANDKAASGATKVMVVPTGT
jgi:2-desacetyl-2-hydroxyethyl bacteriochlorophyllide A dehydrogenase